MEIVANYSQVEYHFGTIDDIGIGPMWQLVVCPACSRVILQRIDVHEGYEPDEWTVKILYPSDDKPLAGLSPKVDKAYQAALKVRSIDSNSAVVFWRTVSKWSRRDHSLLLGK
jgi:hypothetical protein